MSYDPSELLVDPTDAADRGVRLDRLRRRGDVFLAFVALALGAMHITELSSFDAWWHLATGRWIVENGHVPRTDPFSYTASGQPWRYINWLADLVLYGAWSLGGVSALCILKGVVAAARAATIAATLRFLGARLETALAVLLIVVLLAQPRLTMARPFMLASLLEAIAVLAAVVWWRHPGRWIIAWPLFALAWILVHGSGLLAVPLIVGLACASWIWRRGDGAARLCTLAAALTVAAVVAVPDGREAFAMLSATASPVIAQVVSEWAPGDPRRVDGQVAWVVIGLSAAWAVFSLRRAPIVSGLALLGLGLAVLRHRYLPDALIFAAPSFALLLSWLADRARALRPGLRLLTPLVVAMLLLGAHSTRAGDLAVRASFGVGVDEARFDHGAVSFLEALPEGRVLNDMESGGFLIWHEVPGGVLVDGRSGALYPAELFEQLVIEPVQGHGPLDELASRWEATYGYCVRRSPICTVMMTSRDWVPLYHGVSASVFARRAILDERPAVAELALNEVRVVDDERWNLSWYEQVVASELGRGALVAGMAALAERSPKTPVLEQALRAIAAVNEPFARQRVLPAIEAALPDAESP